jgi:putative ABC transport system permease protein
MWQSFTQDLRHALRRLAHQPGFSLAVVLILAAGIGATSAVFSIVDGVLLRPLPFPAADRLVVLNETTRGFWGSLSAPNFLDWKDQNRTFASMAVYRSGGLNLTGKFAPQRVEFAEVSSGFFECLGVHAMRGRLFTSGEYLPGGPNVAVISSGLWNSVFGAAPGMLGRSIELGGTPYTVVGILAEELAYPTGIRVWLPNHLDTAFARNRDTHFFSAIGRLKPEASLEEARADLSAVARRLEQQYPDTNRGRGARVTPLLEQTVARVRPALLILLAAVGLVLLIACANVANLLLARGVSRQREMALRAALGASRARIVRQLLTESAVLGLLGAGLGLAIAYGAVAVLPAVIPARTLPRAAGVELDARVLLFTLAAGLLTAAIFGLAPAFASVRVDPQSGLQQGSTRSTPSSGIARLRSSLIFAEVMLATLLLVGGGLLIRTLGALLHVDPGFEPAHVETAQIYLPKMTPAEVKAMLDRVDQMTARLGALPGAEVASSTAYLPLSGYNINSDFVIEGRPVEDVAHRPVAEMRFISPGFFRVLGIPLLAGRDLSARDNEGAPLVAVINRHMARRFWGEGNAIGKRFAFFDVRNQPQWMEIIGVIGDVHTFGLGDDVRDEVYLPLRQQSAEDLSELSGELSISFVLRNSGPPEALAAAITGALASVDNTMPVGRVESMAVLLGNSLARQRFAATLLGAFALLALVLAGAGIYAVMAYLVAERTHEMGVRLALGATPKGVVGLILWSGMRLTLLGATAGLAASLAATRLLAGQLFGVTPADPPSYLLATALLALTAALACCLPALRAGRVDPMVALRYE